VPSPQATALTSASPRRQPLLRRPGHPLRSGNCRWAPLRSTRCATLRHLWRAGAGSVRFARGVLELARPVPAVVLDLGFRV